MTNTPDFRSGLTQLTANYRSSPYVRAPKQEFCVVPSAASELAKPHDVDMLPSSRTTVLALDLGTTTGWALRPRDGNTAHGFVSFKTQRFEGGGMRYLRFKRWLTEMKSLAGDIHAVYFEEVRRHVGVDAAHVYGGLMATLTTWCEHHNIPYQGVPVGTIKKHATGKGNAGKGEVIAAMRALGHPVTDDNEADALAILHWAIDTQGENT
jgi:Holliday junction resolvasome RuvABC endonuclease subunit